MADDLKLPFEIKESWNTTRPLRDTVGHYPSEVKHIVHVCYPEPAPPVFMEPAAALRLAYLATYYQWQEGRWQLIGDWRAWLRWLQEVTRKDGYEDYEISLDAPFPNHHEFRQWATYQIRPWNELIRCHFDRRPYVGDVDLLIELLRGRRRTPGTASG